MINQIFCKNAYTVATDCSFASIRIIDMDTHFSVDLDRSVKHTVRAKSESSLTQESNLFSLKLYTVFIWIEYQIIITKSLIFNHCNTVFHDETLSFTIYAPFSTVYSFIFTMYIE